MSIILIILNI